MPRTVAMGVRGSGAARGLAGFLDLKKAFNDAVMKMKWEKEKLMFMEGRADVRATQAQRGATSRTLIGAGYTPKDIPGLLATGEAGGFTEPEPEGINLTAGERQRITAMLQSLSEGINPQTGREFTGKADAERFMRFAQIDPDSDPRIRVMLDQFPARVTKRNRQKIKTMLLTAVRSIAGGFLPGGIGGTGGRNAPGREDIPIPSSVKGRARVRGGANVLIDEYQTTTDPDRLKALEQELEALGYTFTD